MKAQTSVSTIAFLLLSATAAHAQWESVLIVGSAIPQGAARKERRPGEALSLSILRNAPTRALGVGMEFSFARMDGKTVQGVGGPFRTADVSIWSVGIAAETTDRNTALSPLLGASIGYAGIKKSDESRTAQALTMNGIAGLRVSIGRVGASLGVSHGVIFTQHATASDTELLRLGMIFVGVRAKL